MLSSFCQLVQAVPEVRQPKLPRAVRHRRIENEAQSVQKVALADAVFPYDHEIPANADVKIGEVSEVLYLDA